MKEINIKALIRVFIDSECIGNTLEDIAIDGVQIGYLYAINAEFRKFADECIEIHERLDQVFKESENVGVCQNALGFYYIEISQSNIPERYNDIMSKNSELV